MTPPTVDVELMVIGCLTVGPQTREQLHQMLLYQTEASIARALESLSAQERVVTLAGGRWALITNPNPRR